MAPIGGDQGIMREFICNDLVKPPRAMTFTKTVNGKDVSQTVEQYFLQEKGIR